jgi:predicted PurR-regulated permease PerM
MLDNKPYTFDRVFRIAVTIGAILGILWLFDYLAEVLIPFAIAFLLAYLINPLVCQVQKKIPKRGPAVFVTLLGISIALVISSYLVWQPIKTQFGKTQEIVMKVSGSDRVDKLRLKLKEYGFDQFQQSDQRNLKEILKSERYTNMIKEVFAKVFPVAKDVLGGLAMGAWSLLLFVLGLSVIFLYLLFILMDYQSVRDNWSHLMPPKWKKPITEFVLEFDDIMNKHFRAQAVVAFLVGVLFAIGFSIIGLPMAILLGLFIGVLNMIPYMQLLGLFPAAILAMMMAIDQETGIMAALLKTGFVFGVVQGLQDAFLVPKIMGKVTGLKPAIILLSISIWGKLLGFFGLLIALPMTCLVLAYYRKFILKHEAKPPEGESPESPEAP